MESQAQILLNTREFNAQTPMPSPVAAFEGFDRVGQAFSAMFETVKALTL